LLKDVGGCFACGKNNPHGLQLDIRKTDDGVEMDYVVPARFQGWQDVIHGGITATILDELCAWACTSKGINAVTAELTTRFRRPLLAGQPIRGIGRVLEVKGRLVIAEARILDQSGTVIAEALGKMMKA
jgi:uncharacterized protein (TIGR00369 family)